MVHGKERKGKRVRERVEAWCLRRERENEKPWAKTENQNESKHFLSKQN